MLDTLLSINTPTKALSYGSMLLQDGALGDLSRDLFQHGIIFLNDDYWTSDKLEESEVSELLEEISGEENNVRVLHLLQLLQKQCPALVRSIDVILGRATC